MDQMSIYLLHAYYATANKNFSVLGMVWGTGLLSCRPAFLTERSDRTVLVHTRNPELWNLVGGGRRGCDGDEQPAPTSFGCSWSHGRENGKSHIL